MEPKLLFNAPDEKTNLNITNITTPFSINDILTKEESKCEFENGMFSSFSAKLKPASYNEFQKKEVLSNMKYYDECNNFREYNEDGVLDMSRKSLPVTELSGELCFSIHFILFNRGILYCIYRGDRRERY